MANVYHANLSGTDLHFTTGDKLSNLSSIPAGAGDIPSANLDGNAVVLTGDQAIAGGKSFLSGLSSGGDIINGVGSKFTTVSGNDLNIDAPTTRSLFLKIGGSTKATIDNEGNFYSVAWTDYSATSTIVGWVSFGTKSIYYKKIGKLVFVCFTIIGTSNATSISFTLPYTSANTIVTFGGAMRIATNNDVGITGASCVRLLSNSATVNCYTDMYEAAWTNSGNKVVSGSFWYESV